MDENAKVRERKMKTTGREQASRAKKDKMLALVSEGVTIAESCRRIGMTRGNYEYWRKSDRFFRAKVDALRVDNVRDLDAPYSGDFISFRSTFFGMDTYYHQREIVRAIELAKPGQIVLVNCPPEHGKTTLLEDWVSYRLATNPNFRVTLVSEGMGHSRKILGRIARRMTEPNIAPDYVERFGPFRIPSARRPWSADFFTVWKADHDERDYSMEARGWKSNIAGTRADLLLVDDIQAFKSLNQTDQMMGAFRQDMLTRPGKEGRVVVVGTRVGQDDFYERLVEEGIVDKHICLPAMDYVDGKWESLCPELWPEQALEVRRKQVGESVWARNYMQAPLASMEATFTAEMVEKAWDITRKVGEIPEWAVSKVCTLDPALAGGNAIHVAAYSVDRYAVIDIDSARGLARVEAILERIEKMAHRYHFEDLIIEKNAFQKGLSGDERLRQMSIEYGFRIGVHETGHNKLDDAIGIARIPLSFIDESISLPGADEASRLKLEPLTHQLLSWRADIPTKKLTQDQVMAFWFGWLFWERKRRGLRSDTTWKTKGVPWPTASGTQWRTNRGLMGVGAPRRAA